MEAACLRQFGARARDQVRDFVVAHSAVRVLLRRFAAKRHDFGAQTVHGQVLGPYAPLVAAYSVGQYRASRSARVGKYG
eukprot:1820793-Rhodomonas_salina.1